MVQNGHQPTPESCQSAAQTLRTLAHACAKGDRFAFERLHDRFSRGILAFFAKRGASAADAPDLAQKVWTGVWAACEAGRFDPERASISTFIYAVASKCWLQYLRAGGVCSSDNSGGDEAIESIVDADLEPMAGLAAAAERLEALRGYLRQRGRDESLTDQEHQILILAASGGSDREVAEKLSLAPSTVNAKKQAGMGKVRRFLARLGYRSEVGERAADIRE